jgi:hypothetical protein
VLTCICACFCFCWYVVSILFDCDAGTTVVWDQHHEKTHKPNNKTTKKDSFVKVFLNIIMRVI